MYGVHAVVGREHGVCPLVGGGLLVGVCIIGDPTVYHFEHRAQTEKLPLSRESWKIADGE